MLNTFNWKIESNIVEFSNIFVVKNAVGVGVRQQLIKEILEYKNNNIDNSGSEIGCWRGHPNFSDNYVSDLIMTVVKLYFDSLPEPARLSKNHDPFNRFDENSPIINCWANVNSLGGYNISHTHIGSLLSGVIYLQAKDTGIIEFTPINYIYKINHPCWLYDGAMQYDPNDGDVILFPSYLLHRVAPNPIEKQRINLAFNISYANK